MDFLTTCILLLTCRAACGINRDIDYTDKNCNTTLYNEGLYINCLISGSQWWNLTTFRDWTFNMKRNYTINVNLRCIKNGRVNLQKPIKAIGLENLTIQNCYVRDFFTYNFSDAVINLNYSIQGLTMKNCTIDVDIGKINYVLSKEYQDKINAYYPCRLAESIKRYINTGEKYQFINSSKPENVNSRKNKEKAIFERKMCVFKHLQYFEKTANQLTSDRNEKDIAYLMSSSKFPKIQVFNFSRLRLREIPYDLYKNEWWIWFQNLKILDLSFNKMTEIIFKNKKPDNHENNLTVILNNNNITNIKREDLQNIKTFYPNFILLKNNPFQCTCDLVHVMKVLRAEQDQDWAISYRYLMDLNCDLNSTIYNKKLKELKEEDVCRRENAELNGDKTFLNFQLLTFLLGAGFVFLCVLIVLLLVLCRANSKKYCLQENITKSFMSKSSVSSTTLKEYDAFLSYSSSDENWVVNVLCKKLESSPLNFSLCLHYKHFIPGAYVAENIIECVEKSRHTIMVLSNNFLKSEWCIMEFRKAFHQSLMENCHLIILILDEDLDLNNTPDLKHCLKTRTYIRVSESLFWNKLICSLIRTSSKGRRKSLKNGYLRSLSDPSTKGKDKSTFQP
ncbi:hypothetical protein KUTeg_018726 [Tegillarca granosa]|uniref:TIR domain-containing protein n=1 Tax=Tegillarca granosa TaxID=220873 RepID=A0ABQ9EER8_TEGGR|nr:hypothetical protein KUTeg_018726 [Tegillarca granosa]